MTPDAVVVGSGPNGLAAAITLAQAGLKTLLREAQPTVGGGLRSSELTLPGFTHDVCSAVHPLALSSPLFRTLPLANFGLEWVQPPAALAHPLDHHVVGSAQVDHHGRGQAALGEHGVEVGGLLLGHRVAVEDESLGRVLNGPNRDGPAFFLFRPIILSSSGVITVSLRL